MLEINKIYNEDCLEGMKRIECESIDLIVTDPPYLINYSRYVKGHKNSKAIIGDSNYNLIDKYIAECYRILKNNSNCFIFGSIKTYSYFEQKIKESGFKIKNVIIWDKMNSGMGDTLTTYAPQYEILFYLEKGKTKINGKRFSDIWQFKKIVGKNQLHQNQKPIELLKRCIINHSNISDIVFDGFLGSGTTAIACINTNRNFIGFELDENYFNIANKRIQDIGGD